MKHFHLLPNGRKFSFVDTEEMHSSSFVHLAKTTSQSEEHLKYLVAKSLQGLRSGHSPTLCESGVGGTYFMHDEYNRTIGVFKPQDEEMWCTNNPKGFTPKTPSFKEYKPSRGAEAGEAAFREYAAYLLDHENFSGVPATGLVVCGHPTFSTGSSYGEHFKIGSFQEFKEHDFDAEDISSSKYQMFPVHEVHKIAILDIRLLNTDRHGGNILIKANRSRANSREDVFSDYDSSDEDCLCSNPRRRRDEADESEMMFKMDMDVDDDYRDCYSPPSPVLSSIEYELIPIDHGYTLPSTLSGLSDLWFEWLKWPQSKIPFGPEEQRYIDRLDPDVDVSILRHKFGELIGSECFKVLKITTTWLKIASKVGLTPYTIGYALCRKSPDAPSTLEKICIEAQQLAETQSTDESTPASKLSSNCSSSSSNNDTTTSNNCTKTNKFTPTSNNDNTNTTTSKDSPCDDTEPGADIQSHSERLFFENLKGTMQRAALELLASQSASRPHTPISYINHKK